MSADLSKLDDDMMSALLDWRQRALRAGHGRKSCRSPG